MEFRHYPLPVDKVLQSVRITYPQDIHNCGYHMIERRVIKSENTNIISNIRKRRNAFSKFIHKCTNISFLIVHRQIFCEKLVNM
jgi:hypothetical protein